MEYSLGILGSRAVKHITCIPDLMQSLFYKIWQSINKLLYINSSRTMSPHIYWHNMLYTYGIIPFTLPMIRPRSHKTAPLPKWLVGGAITPSDPSGETGIGRLRHRQMDRPGKGWSSGRGPNSVCPDRRGSRPDLPPSYVDRLSVRTFVCIKNGMDV
jgi:hypothetical protein